jgi:DEAD/DEAH box helicase domain-containing protein
MMSCVMSGEIRNKRALDVSELLPRLRQKPFFRDQIVHVRRMPERPAVFRDVEGGLKPALAAVLGGMGIDALYDHQAAAIEALRAGRSVVVVTGTASGKTLCYTVPTIERLMDDSRSTMLYLYPTKALAQDQLRGLGAFPQKELGVRFLCGTYDGDTPSALRRKLRDGGNVILTNPDMLHQGILPNHARWNRFFTHLQYVVVDEIHAYRGVFGSHLANVLRRLRRICRHYGATPRFVCCSATIANPAAHAAAITGEAMELIDRDGSPRGPKQVVLWNPPPLERAAQGAPGDWRVGGDRRSARGEAVQIMNALVAGGVQTIAFVRTRLAAELIYRDCRAQLAHVSRKLADALAAYRGGYLPEERREIERRLAAGEILGVAATNALELGIDIGTLDACILVGYPGAISSLWQQAGRAGRAHGEALVFLIAQNAPVDQYLMAHSDYLFGRSPEQAVVDPDNPNIVVGHLKCAAAELPLDEADAARMGPYAGDVLELLEQDGCLRRIDNRWYWASVEHAAAGVSLRNMSGVVYTIQDEAAAERVIGTMDEISAMSQLHEHAVYIHGAETYFVNRLDLDRKIAFVERKELDYYTQSVQSSSIRIDEREIESEWRGGKLGFGDVTVVTTIPMFKKIRFHARDSLGFEKLELPPQTLETVALWYAPPEAARQALMAAGFVPGEALLGIANVLVEVAPLFVMSDTQDIGVVVDAHNLGEDALFLHDRYPGGMGFARRCLDSFDEMMRTVYDVIRDCGCESGCPSCVGSAVPASAMTDLDTAVRGRIPVKAAALALLEFIMQGR